MNFQPPTGPDTDTFLKPQQSFGGARSVNNTNVSPLFRPPSDYGGRPPVQNRLGTNKNNQGPRNVQPYNNFRGNQPNNYKNYTPKGPKGGQNRKRPLSIDSEPTNVPNKRWANNRPNNFKPFPKPQLSAQSRLDKIKTGFTSTLPKDDIEGCSYDSQDPDEDQLQFDIANKPLDDDDTDITIEVSNPAASHNNGLDNIERFKMVLDPRFQKAIKKIQNRRQDKQVVTPFPVTPNVTAMSTNERFSML